MSGHKYTIFILGMLLPLSFATPALSVKNVCFVMVIGFISSQPCRFGLAEVHLYVILRNLIAVAVKEGYNGAP